jgi:acyl-CoA synthetase (AMP-forming)/AMP-acid ligase II
MLTAHSFMRPDFWAEAAKAGCTSFAGVPYMYETLQRLRINPCAGRPQLKTLTQAGGHLRTEAVQHFRAGAEKCGARMFVMYGQTEATARISYVPSEHLAHRAGTIGIAIPRGELWLEAAADDPSHQQLFYRGPNVMLGYANGVDDLSRGDELRGVLPTGDLAERDAGGYFRIVGRMARFAKLFGKRINLASVEAEMETKFAVRTAVIDGGEKLKAFFEAADDKTLSASREYLAAWLGVPPLSIMATRIAQIPMTANGKKDYKALR